MKLEDKPIDIAYDVVTRLIKWGEDTGESGYPSTPALQKAFKEIGYSNLLPKIKNDFPDNWNKLNVDKKADALASMIQQSIKEDIEQSLALDEEFYGRYVETPVNQDPSDSIGEYRGIYDISDPTVFDRVNNVVSTISNRSWVNPYTCIQQIRSKLALVGLNFSNSIKVPDLDEVPQGKSSGAKVLTIPLTQWGGRYGQLDDSSPEITFDDGISSKIPGGLFLVITYVKDRGRYTTTACLKTGSELAEVSDTPDTN